MRKMALVTILALGCMAVLAYAEAPAAPAAPSETPATAPAAEPAVPPVAKPDTPQQALKNMVAAVMTGNKDLFAKTVSVADEDKALANLQFEVLQEMLAFSKDMKKAYKQEGMVPTMPSAQDIDKADIKIEGDKAEVAGGEMQGTTLVKKNDVWLVDVTKDLPKGEQRAAFLKNGPEMVKGIKELRSKIGKEGVTPEQLGMEMMMLMSKAMGGPGAASEPATQPAETTTQEAK